eukprot:14428484-Alexandrium_andersonii.AAC.1
MAARDPSDTATNRIARSSPANRVVIRCPDSAHARSGERRKVPGGAAKTMRRDKGPSLGRALRDHS